MIDSDLTEEINNLLTESYFQGGNDLIDSILEGLEAIQKQGIVILSMHDLKLFMTKAKESFNDNKIDQKELV